LIPVASGVPLKEIAIFIVLSLSFHGNANGILSDAIFPFDIRSGIRFFEQAHIKDVTSYMRVLVNPGDELAWRLC